MKILKTPWKNILLNRIENSFKSVRISSPYIKENICDDILSVKNNDCNLNLITSFKLMNLYSGSLDINGLEKLINGNSVVKNYSKLHAKIYIFDEKEAIVSSGNLTNGGLLNNYEYGILVDEKKLVFQIIEDYEQLFNDENTGLIKDSDLKTVRHILSNIPKSTKIKIPKYEIDDNEEIEVLTTETSNISSSLSGWKKEIFIILDKIKNQSFQLDDVYNYENELSIIYPNNNNIKDKIRQQLQILRDLSLIEFLGNGKYKKLWKRPEQD